MNRKKLESFDREKVGLEPDTKIFINENLSPYMAKLAFYCRVLKRKHLIAKLTTFKGVIKINRTVDGRPLSKVIGHKKDLELIFPNLNDLLNV